MKTLLEDYKKRLDTVNKFINNTRNNESINDEKKMVRLRTKASCYMTIIIELKTEILKQETFEHKVRKQISDIKMLLI